MAQIHPHIHRRLIKRLLLTYCLLSLVIGTVVYFIEMETVDDLVVKLATEESKTFLSTERDHLNSANPADRAYLFRQSEKHIEKGHFIVVELYDRNKQQIVEVTKAGTEQIEDLLNRTGHGFPHKDAASYRKYYNSGNIYLQILVPLKANGGPTIGYFEGVYQVDAHTMELIERRVGRSIVVALLVALITTVTLYPTIIALNKDLIKFSLDLSHANIGMLEVLGNAVAKRDSDTNLHNYRVTLYSIKLAETVGLGKEATQGLIKGSFLHDVGKIGISDTILLKAAKLTEKDRTVMKSHVIHGVDIIKNYQWLQDAVDVVRCHHERYDGSGYMQGLKGEAIPLNARIFAISDVFDALTSKRPYKEPFSFRESMEYLESHKGSLFDPLLVQVFQGIARQLYDELNMAEERVLKEMMQVYIDRYFLLSDDTAPPTR
ncbi:MAG: metal dependent [Geobacteraceae bacterium]|nr:MAG: metal dependent [Geobacteraceae bacterium]